MPIMSTNKKKWANPEIKQIRIKSQTAVKPVPQQFEKKS